jgi:hypothetical protein
VPFRKVTETYQVAYLFFVNNIKPIFTHYNHFRSRKKLCYGKFALAGLFWWLNWSKKKLLELIWDTNYISGNHSSGNWVMRGLSVYAEDKLRLSIPSTRPLQPKLFHTSCWGKISLWNRIWDLGWFRLIGQFRVHEFLVLFMTVLSSIYFGLIS